ncbi:CAP-GLY domain-containing linker protein 3 [Rhizophlyctis rosea]|nr:CAP-GLY domain-containing linker protein 3 [Rhizophlyctis rosea]
MVQRKVEHVTSGWGSIVSGVVHRIQDRINELIIERFPSICRADVEFRRCCENYHWGADLVEEVLTVAVKGLNEGNAVDVLKAIAGTLKGTLEHLHGAGGDMDDMPLVRAKRQCVEFIARKWWSIQQRGLFKDLDDELLAEIAAGIKIDTTTLRNGLDQQPPPRGMIRGAETRTKLRPMVRPPQIEEKTPSPAAPPSKRQSRTNIATAKRPVATPAKSTKNPPASYWQQGAAKSRSRSRQPAPLASNQPAIQVGMRVAVGVSGGTYQGSIRFIGTTSFASGEWVGIELDGAVGKNDGSVQGVRYFDAASDCGVFVRRGAVQEVGGTS